ncbi:Secretin PulD [Phycisphaerales bacterium]|nr:Secretin PulD [Phycisphaerales bacterium]
MQASMCQQVMVTAVALAALAGRALAFQAEPQAAPESVFKVAPVTDTPIGARMKKPSQPPVGRRPLTGEPTVLAFKQVTVERLVDFIVQATGKVVIPQQDILSRKITVMNDAPIPREQALDLVFLSLAQNGVGVVENDITITLRDIAEVTKQDVPVIGPEWTVLNRSDLGTLVQKVFGLRHSSAKSMGDIIKNAVPDTAKLQIDEESNQVTVMGPLAMVQRVELLVDSLDRPSAAALQAETFTLRYADAEAIKTNINELFGQSATRNRNQNNQNQNQPVFRFPGQGGDATTSASTDEVRVTANSQQNSVTVVADPAILEQIRQQIVKFWDTPLSEDQVIPKTYDLHNSDPVKVRDLLEGLFGKPQTRTGQQGGGQQGGQQGAGSLGTSSTQGIGRLAGQFSFQAMPDQGRLVVIGKSPDNMEVIDKIIKELDQPQTAGLPAILELKHASAEDLAEQLNTLLAQDGTLAQIRRSESGLSATSSNLSPFSTTAVESAASDTSATDDGATSTTNISFWWARSRTPTDRRPSSNLIGQLRIVPVWRQNALMVTAPPEYRQSIISLIEMLDKPGRQVLISAIVAEVSAEDATQLGLRWSSQAITPTNGDNSVSIGTTATGEKTNFATSLFDTSTLSSNVDLNLLLQALSQKQAVSILSEPKVFTSDNQEAEFFDGQDVLVPTASQTADTGAVTQTFDYRAVGIQLRARPRITVQGDVDLRVNLQLSSIVPGETSNGGFIFDRRQTTTQLIVKDGQTIVISGILRKQESNILRKVPLIGDIPVLGWLFRSRDKSITTTELLVFITPVVVNNTEKAATEPVNAPYRERLEKLRKDLGSPAPAPTQDPAKETGEVPDASKAN